MGFSVLMGKSGNNQPRGAARQRTFYSPTKPKTMNKIERIFDAVMHCITMLAIAGGFYWIFIRFIITYLKTL